MIAEKYELARAVEQARDVAAKRSVIPALEGVLVKNGYFIGSNSELSIQVKSEGCEGECFILPPVAMDMIKNLPDGEVEIKTNDKFELLIKAGKVKHRCQSFSPDDYTYYQDHSERESEITLPGEQLCDAITRVAFAADEKASGITAGIYLEAKDGEMNVVALNNHTAAWDRIPYEGEAPVKAIIPKTSAMKLTALGIVDDMDVSYNRFSAIFHSGSFTVSSRLIDGDYVNYRRVFDRGEHEAVIPRKVMIAALSRASLCIKEGTKNPVVFTFKNGEIGISLAASNSVYVDAIPIDGGADAEGLRIGFDPAVLIKTLRNFPQDMLQMEYTAKNKPVFFNAEGEPLKTLVLPVNIAG